MKYPLSLIAFVILWSCDSPAPKTVSVRWLDEGDNLELHRILDADPTEANRSSIDYEDEFQKIEGFCMGEFGSGVLIWNKGESPTLHYLHHSNCPKQFILMGDTIVVVGYTGHGDGFSSLILIHDFNRLEALPVPADSDTLRVPNKYYDSFSDPNEWLENYSKWKHSQADWLIDSMGINLLSAYPNSEGNMTILYDYFNWRDSTNQNGLYMAQVSTSAKQLNKLSEVHRIANNLRNPRSTYYGKALFRGENYPLVRFPYGQVTDSLQLSILNTGDTLWAKQTPSSPLR